MSVVIYGTDNILSDLGQRYFFSKYGFPKDKIKEHIIIRETKTQNIDEKKSEDIDTYIIFHDYTLPAFNSFQFVNEEGKIIAIAEKNGITYPCIVNDGNDTIIGFDIFFYIGFCLSGQLEPIWNKMGKEKEKFVRIPFVDIYSDLLFAALCESFSLSKKPLVYKSFWPEGKKFAVCLTHDVDEIRKTYQWITYPLRMIRRKDLNGLKNQIHSLQKKLNGIEPFWTFPLLISLEKRLNVRSSLYFLNEKGKAKIFDKSTWRHIGRRYSPRHPDISSLIRIMYSEGWDIGLHGSFYSYTNPELLRTEKDELEEALGSKVIGTRQHNLNLKIPDTWVYQSEAGLVYDTTLGFNDTIGFRWGVCFPFQLYNINRKSDINLLEIPLNIEEIALFKQKNYQERYLQIEKEVERFQGVLTLLWHHSVMNKFEFPGWGEYYEEIIGRCLENNAWVTHAAAISKWWYERGKFPIQWDYKDNLLTIFPQSDESGYYQCVLPDGMKMKNVNNASIIATRGYNFTIKSKAGDMDEIQINLEG